MKQAATQHRRIREWVGGLFAATLASFILAFAAPASAAPLHISLGSGTHFPDRALVLSVPPGPQLTANRIHVTENGSAVSGVAVNSLHSAKLGDFGVVLAIDTSQTMRGGPLQEAMKAARSLASQRTANQELGIVTFDATPRVALPLTNDPASIRGALARPPAVGSGAHIYDALALSLQQLSQANVAAGAVILLSDGANPGNTPHPGNQPTLQSIASTANSAHARIFTIGLRDRSFTPQRMSVLAQVGGGEFLESTSSQLDQIFTRIEADLISKYIVRYRSQQPANSEVGVILRVDGVPGTSTVRYASPSPLPLPPARHKLPPLPRHTSFWSSGLALAVFGFGSALFIGIALVTLVAAGARRQSLRERIGEFASDPVTARFERHQTSPSRLFHRTERSLANTTWWTELNEELEISRIGRSVAQLAWFTLFATITAAVLFSVIAGTAVLAVPVLLAGPFALRAFVRQRADAQRKLYDDQIAGHVQEIASAMRAGHSIVAAISATQEAAQEPIRGEFQRVMADEQLGRPLDDGLKIVARRMQSEATLQIALVAALLQDTGGSMAEVLDRIAEGTRERAELKRELQSLTAQARLSRWVVTGLPPALLGIVEILNPSYERPLFHTTGGLLLLLLATVMIVIGSLVMKTIVRIEA